MTENQFYDMMAAIGFGFGSLFWLFITWLIFAERAK